jgi:hypothetical protein
VVREQTRDAILHLERAERLLKLGELDKALVEYEYIVGDVVEAKRLYRQASAYYTARNAALICSASIWM